MGRNSIKMELIEKESTRVFTYQKRKKSLLKKISEFSILCGVDALMIIFGPKLKDQQLKLDTVWPSNSDEARKIIDKYKKSDGAKRTYTVCDYFSEKNKKLQLDISKLRKKICEAKYPSWDIRLDNFSADELRLLVSRLDTKIAAADKKLNLLKQNQNKDLMLSHMPENTLPVDCFQPGESLFMNWGNLNCCSSDLQLFSVSTWMNPGRSVIERKPNEQHFEEGNMNSWAIWQNQSNYLNNLSLNWENLRMNNGDNSVGSNLEIMLPQMVFPVPSLPYQVRPPQ